MYIYIKVPKKILFWDVLYEKNNKKRALGSILYKIDKNHVLVIDYWLWVMG